MTLWLCLPNDCSFRVLRLTPSFNALLYFFGVGVGLGAVFERVPPPQGESGGESGGQGGTLQVGQSGWSVGAGAGAAMSAARGVKENGANTKQNIAIARNQRTILICPPQGLSFR